MMLKKLERLKKEQTMKLNYEVLVLVRKISRLSSTLIYKLTILMNSESTFF